MLMSAVCTNEMVTTQLTVLKVQILTKSKLFSHYCTIFRMLLSFVSSCKLAIALLLVDSYPLSDITVHMPISSTHACMMRNLSFICMLLYARYSIRYRTCLRNMY